MERFAGRDLKSFQVNMVLAVEFQMGLGKILAHHADQPDGREKAGRDGGMAGRTAQQARMMRGRCCDGIKGR